MSAFCFFPFIDKKEKGKETKEHHSTWGLQYFQLIDWFQYHLHKQCRCSDISVNISIQFSWHFLWCHRMSSWMMSNLCCLLYNGMAAIFKMETSQINSKPLIWWFHVLLFFLRSKSPQICHFNVNGKKWKRNSSLDMVWTEKRWISSVIWNEICHYDHSHSPMVGGKSCF